MGYVRIIIHLCNGAKRSGVRAFSEPMNLVEIRKHAWQLSAEVLGHGEIEDVTVKEVPSDDPAVVALILKEKGMRKRIAPSDGVHPYLKDQARKPPR